LAETGDFENKRVAENRPKLPGHALAKLEAHRLRAEDKLSNELDSFWFNVTSKNKELGMSAFDLSKLFLQYAGAVYDARASEFIHCFKSAPEYENFLRHRLSSDILEELLPPRSARPFGAPEVIGLHEPIGKFTDRIGRDDYSSGFSRPEGIWERLVEDTTVKAIRLDITFPNDLALTWVFRDVRNRSEFCEFFEVFFERKWRTFVARWHAEVANTVVPATPPVEKAASITRTRPADRGDQSARAEQISRGERARPGPKPKTEIYNRVRKIVDTISGADWTNSLDEICEALDEEKVPIPSTWRVRSRSVHNWTDGLYEDREKVRKAIEYRLKS
jgi:hypothetical protein